MPGTPQAKEAVIANEIPQTATISRSAATLTVTYEGAPVFQPITGTNMTYAVNSSDSRDLRSRQHLLRREQRRVVMSAGATGPWGWRHGAAGDLHHSAEFPVHYVTYVQVYGYTPSVVYVGYTPGYYGTVVSSMAWSSMEPAITIRLTSGPRSGCLPLTPMESAQALPGARPPDGRSASVWAWPSDPGAARGGDRSAIGAGAGELRPGDGEVGVARPPPTSTAAGATRPTREPAPPGRIPGRVTSVPALAETITTPSPATADMPLTAKTITPIPATTPRARE